MKQAFLSGILDGNFDRIMDAAVFGSTAAFARTVKWSLLIRKLGVASLIGSIDQALAIANDCVAMAKRMAVKKMMADSYLSLAEVQSDFGDFEAVMNAAKSALSYYLDIGDINGQAWALNQLARAHGILGEPRLSEEEHKRAGELFEEKGNLEGQAYTCNNLANKYWREGDMVKALAYYEKSLHLFEELGMNLQVALALNNVGTVFQRIGEYEKAGRNFREAMRIRREAGDKLGVATCFNNLGMNDMLRGNFRQALEGFEKALQIRATTSEIRERGIILSNMGNAHAKLGNRSEAMRLFHDARLIKKRMADEYSLAITDMHCATAFIEDGKFDEADKMVAEVEAINERLRNPELGARINETKMLMRLEQGLPIEPDLQRSLLAEIEPAEKNGLKVRIGALRMMLGRSVMQKKDYARAGEEMRRALEIFAGVGDVYNQGRCLYYLARIEAEQGRTDQARTELQHALSVFKGIEAAGWVIRVTNQLQAVEAAGS